jgi:hypothetical protein
VTTAQGKEPIGKLHVGEKVLAYNPRTHKMELQLVLHVWKHMDSDLIDLTITTVTATAQSHKVVRQSEVVHTSSEHPFFTKEQGFVPAGKLEPGMHILRADGRSGIVTGWKAVHVTKVMYNLEVARDHTFVVGEGQWVVHNECSSQRLRRRIPGLNGGVEYQAQHLLPCETAFGQKPHDLVVKAVNAANDDWFNEAWNGEALPKNPGDSKSVGRPWHSGSHPNYTQGVYSLLDSLPASLPSNIPGLAARQPLEELAATLRQLIYATGGGSCIDDLFL